VTTVTSLSAARATLSVTDFDAVLCDYDLDDGKGDALVGWLASRPIRPQVIAISSHDAGNDALVKAGAVAVCPKLRFQEIGEVLERIRGGSR
jgi:DNA-binding response OmpR family regulator